MLDLSFMARDVATAARDIPSTLVFGASSCVCVASPVRMSEDTQDIGEFQDYDMEASYCLADMDSHPSPKETVEIDGTKFYVVTKESDSQVVRLTLRRRT